MQRTVANVAAVRFFPRVHRPGARPGRTEAPAIRLNDLVGVHGLEPWTR